MVTYELIDKNSSMVIIISAENEQEARREVLENINDLKFFSCNEVC